MFQLVRSGQVNDLKFKKEEHNDNIKFRKCLKAVSEVQMVINVSFLYHNCPN